VPRDRLILSLYFMTLFRSAWSNYKPGGHIWPVDRIFKAASFLNIDCCVYPILSMERNPFSAKNQTL